MSTTCYIVKKHAGRYYVAETSDGGWVGPFHRTNLIRLEALAKTRAIIRTEEDTIILVPYEVSK